MPEHIAGFSHCEIGFDERGALTDAAALDATIDQMRDAGLTDLIVLCHGWNNDRKIARSLYERFFGEMRKVLDRSQPTADRVVGTLGVYWPSMRWADEPEAAGGAASIGDAPATESELVTSLKAVYAEPAQQQAIDEMAELLDRQPESLEDLQQFQRLLATLTPDADELDETEEAGAALLVDDGHTREVFELLSEESDIRAPQGAADLGSPFRRLWAGAKEALRQATYWQMKKRAGVIGRTGLGPLLSKLRDELSSPDSTLSIHLCGHSFGARLVSFALAGLPDDGKPSPVTSMLLVQGAFSHFTFADELPHDRQRGGALAGMADRVDGPVLVTHSERDLAVTRLYPLASLVARQDAAALEDRLFRWGAMGFQGAQSVNAHGERLGRVGTAYPFQQHGVINLDSNHVIRKGGPPAGAHSDIFHPEIAWAGLSAAGLVAA